MHGLHHVYNVYGVMQVMINCRAGTRSHDQLEVLMAHLCANQNVPCTNHDLCTFWLAGLIYPITIPLKLPRPVQAAGKCRILSILLRQLSPIGATTLEYHPASSE